MTLIAAQPDLFGDLGLAGLSQADAFVTPNVAPRSIYHLTGEARHEWEHSIAAMEVTRWSITFRSLSEKGRLQKRA